MSSSRKESGGNACDQLVTVETSTLKERLNSMYSAARAKTAQLNGFGNLWDMKEKALLEGKGSLEVPQVWLDELDGALAESHRPAKH